MINSSKISIHRFIATTLFRVVKEWPHSSGNIHEYIYIYIYIYIYVRCMKDGNKTRYPILLANFKDRSHASLNYLLALSVCRPKRIVGMTFLTLAVHPERIKALYGLLTGCQSLLQLLPVHHLSVISLV